MTPRSVCVWAHQTGTNGRSVSSCPSASMWFIWHEVSLSRRALGTASELLLLTWICGSNAGRRWIIISRCPLLAGLVFWMLTVFCFWRIREYLRYKGRFMTSDECILFLHLMFHRILPSNYFLHIKLTLLLSNVSWTPSWKSSDQYISLKIAAQQHFCVLKSSERGGGKPCV